MGQEAGSSGGGSSTESGDFLPNCPVSYLPSRRAARRGARSLPHPGLLHPPTHLLPPLRTHSGTELPKISTLRPPPSLTSFQHFLSWMILGFVRQEKKEGVRAGEGQDACFSLRPSRLKARQRAPGRGPHAAPRGLLAPRGRRDPRARVLSGAPRKAESRARPPSPPPSQAEENTRRHRRSL